MSSLITHAKKEFEILGWPGDCELQKMACDAVIELLEVFSAQNHSEFSANYVLKLFNKLAKFDPISPLMDTDDEWNKVSDNLWQNKRDSEVFKNDKNEAYWVRGKIFIDKEGCAYTSIESRVHITFPWIKPEPKIIKEKD